LQIRIYTYAASEKELFGKLAAESQFNSRDLMVEGKRWGVYPDSDWGVPFWTDSL